MTISISAADPHLVPRSAMPQVDEKDLGKLIVFMTEGGFPVIGAGKSRGFVHHQDVDWGKAKAMSAAVLDKPILVTRDDEIIDGNHRNARHTLDGTRTPFIKFDVSFAEALSILAVFPFAYELRSTTPERN